MKTELKRKAFHLLSLVYTLGYIYLERPLILKILFWILLVEGSIEFGRFYFPSFNSKLLAMLGGIHRKDEVHKTSGIFWTLLGTLLTMYFFKDRSVVLCAMGYLIFGDLAAALVGIQFGRHKYFNKSLEGSAAFFCVGLPIGYYFFDVKIAILGALVGMTAEFLPLKMNDNLVVPVLSALFLNWMI